MVSLEGKDVVCFTVNHGTRNVFLALEGVDGHDAALMNSTWSSSGTDVISLDFSSV
ncbi:MAG TPA: hypothetical protein VHP83_03490 [Aggregatilineaceae bacterium]|nr:hypothetical protein [Aggregatilineaceae bacterium]